MYGQCWGWTGTAEEQNKPQLKLTVTSSVRGSPFLSPSCKEDSTGNKKAIHPRSLASHVTDAIHPDQCVIQTNKDGTSSKDSSFSPVIEQIKQVFNCQRTGQLVSYVVFSSSIMQTWSVCNSSITNTINDLALCDSCPCQHLYKCGGHHWCFLAPCFKNNCVLFTLCPSSGENPGMFLPCSL